MLLPSPMLSAFKLAEKALVKWTKGILSVRLIGISSGHNQVQRIVGIVTYYNTKQRTHVGADEIKSVYKWSVILILSLPLFNFMILEKQTQ